MIDPSIKPTLLLYGWVIMTNWFSEKYLLIYFINTMSVCVLKFWKSWIVVWRQSDSQFWLSVTFGTNFRLKIWWHIEERMKIHLAFILNAFHVFIFYSFDRLHWKCNHIGTPKTLVWAHCIGIDTASSIWHHIGICRFVSMSQMRACDAPGSLRCFLYVSALSGFSNTLRPRQDGRHFADDISTCNFLNENCCILIKFSLKYVRKGPIDNNPALVQIMARCRPGDKPLSEPMMVNLLTHICVTRSQWVNVNGCYWLPRWLWCLSILYQIIMLVIYIIVIGVALTYPGPSLSFGLTFHRYGEMLFCLIMVLSNVVILWQKYCWSGSLLLIQTRKTFRESNSYAVKHQTWRDVIILAVCLFVMISEFIMIGISIWCFISKQNFITAYIFPVITGPATQKLIKC